MRFAIWSLDLEFAFFITLSSVRTGFSLDSIMSLPSALHHCLLLHAVKKEHLTCLFSSFLKAKCLYPWSSIFPFVNRAIDPSCTTLHNDKSSNCKDCKPGNPKTLNPVHGPPLRTGAVDYLRTGRRTTPTDPSTRIRTPLRITRQIKYKTKIKISLTACDHLITCVSSSSLRPGQS